MNQVAAIFDCVVLYRYSLILALAGAAGVCFFLACCSHVQVAPRRAAAAALTAVAMSLLLSRLVYWYSRPDTFASVSQALTAASTGAFALVGSFAGCACSALLWGGKQEGRKLLDCMSVAGCWAIALGRLGCFFNTTNRGQIMSRLTSLPWAYPVANLSGQLEYRFATFLFQAAVAAALGVFLTVLFARRKQPGEVSVLFVLIYSASQVILDSTRYDSLYLRSNGFVSMVQILSAVGLAFTLIFLCGRVLRKRGMQRWMVPLWFALVALFAAAGYMEYYVQRHGREAAFSYSVMGLCLIGLTALGLLLWKLSQPSGKEE